jgi:hypothetical protein
MQQVSLSPTKDGAAAPARRRVGVDAFTLWVGVAAALMIPLVLVLVLAQPRPAPLSEAGPAGVAHNFYLAVMQDDLGKAYGYLSSETRGWLTYEQFTAQVSARPETRSARIYDERIEDGTARVMVNITLYMPTGPFSSGEITSQRMLVLKREGEVWRIALPAPPAGAPSGVYPYDLYAW